MRTVFDLEVPTQTDERQELERLRRENQDLRRRLVIMERERERLFREQSALKPLAAALAMPQLDHLELRKRIPFPVSGRRPLRQG